MQNKHNRDTVKEQSLGSKNVQEKCCSGFEPGTLHTYMPKPFITLPPLLVDHLT